MSEEKKEQKKITCSCGSVIFEKNMLAHCKTRKHQASLGTSTSRVPKDLQRSKSHVNFAQAQQSTRADVDDELSDADQEEESDADQEDAEEVLEEVLIILESLDQRVNAMDTLIRDVVKTLQILSQKSDTNFERIDETRLKTLTCLGELREISMRLPKLHAVDPFGVTVSLAD